MRSPAAENQIEHRRTEIGSEKTSGFCERCHTVKEEFFSVGLRRTLYESVAQLQRDLDNYLAFLQPRARTQNSETKGGRCIRHCCTASGHTRHEQADAESG